MTSRDDYLEEFKADLDDPRRPLFILFTGEQFQLSLLMSGSVQVLSKYACIGAYTRK